MGELPFRGGEDERAVARGRVGEEEVAVEADLEVKDP